MYQLVLMRHGESQWNLENRFTGWADVGLTAKGIEEARKAGALLKEHQFEFDIAYTSVLTRAIHTLENTLSTMGQSWIPVHKAWQLNERHYGDLQGLNKAETAARFGEEQVLVWRRAYAIAPNPMTPEDPRYAGHDRRYKRLSPAQIPLTECLKDTVERVVPFWNDSIAPAVLAGKQVLVVAHGNSLRALIKHLEQMSDEAILNVNIPTAQPLVYTLHETLTPIEKRYLGNADEIAAAMAQVANQGKAK